MTPTFLAHYRIPLGVALGLLGAAAALAVWPATGPAPADQPAGTLLSECDGALGELVIHYLPEAAATVAPIYRDFLRQLPAEVTVRVVCRGQEDFDDLTVRVGPVACGLAPVLVDHAITGWSRDRWLALRPASVGKGTILLCPRGENGAGVWPAREGDERVAGDLAAALKPVTVQHSDLFFDGGDVAADSETAFVTPAMPLRNVQRTVETIEELRERLARVLNRRVVLLHGTPDHHTAMTMIPVGDRTVLVGDPALAKRLLDAAGQNVDEAFSTAGGPDFSPAAIAQFDAAAEQCRAADYRVVRIPTVPGRDGRTFFTYVNVIMECRGDQRIVYMPVFSAAEGLNRAAAEVWTELGYEVRPVNCDSCYRCFGTLHCLVNVLRREP